MFGSLRNTKLHSVQHFAHYVTASRDQIQPFQVTVSVVTTVVTPFLIPLCHLASSASIFQKPSLSEVLPLLPVTVVVCVVCSATGRRSSSACWIPKAELLCRKSPLDILNHGVPEPWLVEPRVALKRGLSVAMQPAVIPTPTSTVVQIAKSVVR